MTYRDFAPVLGSARHVLWERNESFEQHSRTTRCGVLATSRKHLFVGGVTV